MQQRSSENIWGIDVSHHQGDINWNKVKAAGIDFVYVKSSEGQTYEDPKFFNNVHGACGVGLAVGAYHFARPNHNPAELEASLFIRRLESVKTDLMPVLDLEYPSKSEFISTNDLVTWVRAFSAFIQRKLHRPLMIYTGNWFVNLHNNFNYALKDMPLWISNYSKSAPPDAGGWTSWVVWQYSDKGKIPGISGNVDLNHAISIEALKK